MFTNNNFTPANMMNNQMQQQYQYQMNQYYHHQQQQSQLHYQVPVASLHQNTYNQESVVNSVNNGVQFSNDFSNTIDSDLSISPVSYSANQNHLNTTPINNQSNNSTNHHYSPVLNTQVNDQSLNRDDYENKTTSNASNKNKNKNQQTANAMMENENNHLEQNNLLSQNVVDTITTSNQNHHSAFTPIPNTHQYSHHNQGLIHTNISPNYVQMQQLHHLQNIK